MSEKKVPVRRRKKDTQAEKSVDAVETANESVSDLQVADDNDGIGPSGIAWYNVKRRIRDLKEWDRNPRKLTDSQAKHIATSIIKFGYAEPITLNADNRIIGGHQRARILLQAGLITMDTQLDVRLPSRPLTDEEHEELALRLNKNTGEWDWEKLSVEFDQNFLREVGFSPMDFGMVASRMDAMKPIGPVESHMRPSNLKPSSPRICPHCEEKCHCVVEER